MTELAQVTEIHQALKILNADLDAGIAPNAILLAKLDRLYGQCPDPGISAQIQRIKNRMRVKKYLGRDLIRNTMPPAGDAVGRRLWEAVDGLKSAFAAVHSDAQALEARYELGEFVGHGGMSEVVKAVRRSDGQTVAIKYLKTEHFDKKGYVARFKRECAHALQFNHPHIVRSFEAGEHNGHGFIVMEYLPLGDVEKFIAHSRPKPGEALAAAFQAAEALAYLHDEMQMVHRDVKLSNLLVASWPPDTNDTIGQIHIKLTDFGLSKEMADDGLTRIGAGMGTSGYQAPEMVNDAARADHRADIFSLGVATYRMLAGRFPELGAYRPLGADRPEIPPKLDNLLAYALQPSRDVRLASATEFAAAVKDIQAEMRAA